MKKGKLLIISGFSGVGKGTVVKYILDNYSDYKISISATTRSPREGEVDGTHYHFLTTEKFEDMIKNNQLLEYANYVGNYYGTPRDFVEKNINEGNNVITFIYVLFNKISWSSVIITYIISILQKLIILNHIFKLFSCKEMIMCAVNLALSGTSCCGWNWNLVIWIIIKNIFYNCSFSNSGKTWNN